MKRFAIIGAPCIDEVISPSGEITSRQLGGILYSYAVAERLIASLGLNVEVIPLSFISIADADLLQPFFSSLHHFNFSFAPRTYDHLSNRVKLLYKTDSSRTEYCASILPELTAEHLPAALLQSLDGIFINMISGFDITLPTLQHIRSNTDAYIHLDTHALILGELSSDSEKPRKVSGVKEWRQWLSNVDSLQCNEMEADWLGVPDTTTEMELLRAARSLYNKNGYPKQFVITRAERGATVFDFTTEQIWNKAPYQKDIRNTTGSGDVFGAAYTLSRMLGTSVEQSLWQAEAIAGWNATLDQLEELLKAPFGPEIGESVAK